jgi:hypothetical protein
MGSWSRPSLQVSGAILHASDEKGWPLMPGHEQMDPDRKFAVAVITAEIPRKNKIQQIVDKLKRVRADEREKSREEGK